MVVEELLELLVAEVDAHLFEAVVVEDLEAGNVQNADEGDPGFRAMNSTGIELKDCDKIKIDVG